MTVLPFSPEEIHNLQLPRILCLHGGGSNARIFQAQCRVLRAELLPYFRFVFVNAPYPSEPGPDVTSVYKNFGQYRRWLRSGAHHPHVPAQEAVEEIENALTLAKDQSDRQGATGEWVGVLGFSQGAKVALSLLLRQQDYAAKLGKHFAPDNFRFAVSMAGRAPLVSLDQDMLSDPALLDASQFTVEQTPGLATKCREENVLRLPTVHVHGLNDPGLHLHQALLNDCCAKNETTLVEWDGTHRVPIETKDVLPVANAIIDIAQVTGVLP
ncbi:MAG: hypothetical protein L6R38_002300 [Xanthoria sp. 2 TBL-2021]|nr:MAG: hypothetical protein L6R38_002300 [Xanthoria sp. 2 TBL-2021]